MNLKLQRAPEGTPVRWQCRYKHGPWARITQRQYESLLGNWDYELRTVNVVPTMKDLTNDRSHDAAMAQESGE